MKAKDLHPQGITLDQWQDLDWTSDCPSETVIGRPGVQASRSGNSQAVVCVCMDETGTLTQTPLISVSSGTPKIDEAAIKLATVAPGLYTEGFVNGKPPDRCQKFALTFKPYNP
jgi:hypothetical protein